MKMTGAEFTAWQNADWGHTDAHWDDYVLLINGVEVDDYEPDEIGATDSVQIRGGVVILGGSREHITAQKHFNAWKKAQAFATIVVEVAKEREQELRDLLTKFGATIAK